MGIVLAVCGAGLYFLRSFKPALARDYDVFFAAIGLLCGGILFFQGWRLDPILQFGQFLLAGTTVFFAYESVRLRGVATDQARRSSYFDDEPSPARMPSGGLSNNWDDSYDQFEEPSPVTRRFAGRNSQNTQASSEDFYRPRRTSRAAIPEQAESRSVRNQSFNQDSWQEEKSTQARRLARFGPNDEDSGSSFGERRNQRQGQRRGSRPSVNQKTSSPQANLVDQSRRRSSTRSRYSSGGSSQAPQSSRLRDQAEDAAFSSSPRRRESSRAQPSSRNRSTTERASGLSSETQDGRSSPSSRRRDNSSRFDD